MGALHRVALAGAAAALAATLSAPARADRLASLPGYEREAVEQVLAERRLRIEDAPAGKAVGRILVENLQVFSDKDHAFTILNALHATTTERTIAREVLLRPGALWDEALAAETARRLRDPELTAFIAVVPVESPKAGHVDVLVVTRDAWSLRANSDFELQEGILTFLYLEPAENNFLGRRKRVGALFEMDQGAYTAGALYRDPNIKGSRIEASAAAGLTFARSDNDLEGSRETVHVAYPLWSLATRYGASLDAEHRAAVQRTFQGEEIATYDAPDTPEDDAIPRAFRLATYRVALEGVRRFGDYVKQDVGVGYELSVQRPSVLDDLQADPAAISAFERDVLPRSELISAVVARYHLFLNDYIVYEDINLFDLSEERLLGPELELRVATASRALGSDDDLVRIDGAVGWHIDFDRVAFVRGRAEAGARYDGQGMSDAEVRGQIKLAGPPLGGIVRPLLGARIEALHNDLQNRVLAVGGDTGLRAFEVGEFMGETAAVVNAELRSMPLAVGSLRVGALAFWDAGHAAPSLSELGLRQDAGGGLRVFIPQGGFVIRFDWAFPIGAADPGFPGRISGGFGQVF